MDDRIKTLRAEARKKLDEAAKILSGEEVSDELAEQAVALQTSAKEIIDKAAQLLEIMDLGATIPIEREGDSSEAGWEGAVSEEEAEGLKKAAKKKAAAFDDLGEFVKAVARAAKGRGTDKRLKFATKDMAEGAMATGGALVPPEFMQELLKYDGQSNIVRPRARVIPMAGRSLSMPVIDHAVHAVAGKSNFYGGVLTYWIEEAGAKTIEDITFDKIELVLHKLCGYTRSSDELMEDSNPTIAAVISMLFGDAIEWKEDYAYLQGNGVGQPLGVVGAPGTFTQVRVAALNFGYVDAVNMLTHFLPVKGGVWVMSRSVMPELFTMVDPGNNYIWHPHFGGAGAAQAGPSTLLGYPVLFTEKTPTLGTTGDVLLCDFSQYLIGDGSTTTLESSIHERFRYDQTSFRLVKRVDGQEWCKAPILLADGATSISPFVELDAATA